MRKQSFLQHNYKLVHRNHLVDLDGHMLHLIVLKPVLPGLSLVLEPLREEGSVPLGLLQGLGRHQQDLAVVIPVVVVLLNLLLE